MPDVGISPPPGREAIDAALRRVADDARALVPGRVAEGIAYVLEGEGKRIRGLLVMAAYGACGGRGNAAPLAAAVEVVHAYSLVHDDLPCMDDDDMRRGRPALHRAFDVATATTVGLVMIPLAARQAARAGGELGLSPRECAELARRLMHASGASGLVGGQLLDLEAEGRTIPLAELERIHRGKTASLIEASVALGGLAARAGAHVLEALQQYGERVGLAFQIADDVLDETETTAQLGKTAGRDRHLRKSTYPSLLGIDEARARAARLVDEACLAIEGAALPAGELRVLAEFAIHRRS